MEILTIILFGLVFNILCLFILIVSATYLMVTNRFNPEMAKMMLLLRKGLIEKERLQDLLRTHHKNPYLQTEFIILLPFAGGLATLGLILPNPVINLIQGLDADIFKLEQRCSSYGITYK